jgi:hypothetical protein
VAGYLTPHGVLHRRPHLLPDQPAAQEAGDDVYLQLADQSASTIRPANEAVVAATLYYV